MCTTLLLNTVNMKNEIDHNCSILLLVQPNQETSVIKKEDETVTLSCSYDTSSSNVRLYWYRQYPNGELHYLIYKYSGGGGGSPSDPRFQSTTPQSSTELTITGVTLSDSALYYCALRVAAQ
uniref:Ig-like domain-containing protein n=1 Tax=Cyprinus carpio carpio TaxID=630221 RepID=A0A8C0YT51_CYPCA